MQQAPRYTNIHGRRWGRGARPWLLLPKYAFVSIFLGGLVTMLILGFVQPRPETLAEWRRRELLLSHAYVRVIVPGLLGAILMGLLLLSTHFRVFIRMRWLQAKLVLLAVCVPSLHFYMRGKATALHAVLSDESRADLTRAGELWGDLRLGTLLSLCFAVCLVILGRIKPRLGQDYGRTFGAGSRRQALPADADSSALPEQRTHLTSSL
jgi:hypothetical protein